MAERAGIFEDDAADFDLSKFKPKPAGKPKEPSPAADAVRAVSETANFRSREAAPAAAREPVKPSVTRTRRRRTGRSLQLNVKLDAQTLESFYEVSDSQGWVLGETLTRAIAALKKELAAEK